MEFGSSSGSSIGCGGKIFGIFWTAFSSIFLCFGLWITWGALEAWKWQSVPCVIERFEIAADQQQDPPFRPDLLYRYEIDGRKYTGTRLWKDKEGSDDYEDLAELRERLAEAPEGRLASLANVATECRVKPGEPETSTLMPPGSGAIWGGLVFAAFGGFFVLIGLGLVFSQGRSATAVSKKGQEKPFVAVVAFLFFGCAGLGVLVGLVIPKAAERLAMRGWKETDAEVIWSRVRSKSDSDGTTYAVDLFYRYQVDGRDYRSNRYDLLGGSSSGSKGKYEVTNAHPPGSKLTVFVDPDEPWRAVVNRSVGWWGLFALFPLPFLAVGGGGLWWFFKKRGEGNSVSRPRGGRTAPRRTHRAGPKPLVAGDWVRLGSSRVGAFIGLLFFALFWNGIVSFGVRDAVGGLSNGGGIGRVFGGGLSLFMIPFVLVGIGLIIGVLYAFAAMFVPRFEIQLADANLKPGRSVRLQWRRAGGIGETRDFSLLLVGREEATCSQGSSNSTARSVFHEEVLFETTVPQAMTSGSVSLPIPGDSVPSFRGKHNRIVWLLCLRAKVPWLPNLRDEREIVVLPFDVTELP